MARMSTAAALVLALAVVACRPSSAAGVAPDAGPAPAPAPAPDRPRSIDATFVVASDTHFGFGGIEEINTRMVDAIRRLPGKAWPGPAKASVGPLAGVVVTGDLTEWGRPEEHERFMMWWGGRGTPSKVDLPVFEMVGNHDKVSGPFVEQRVAARHGGRFYSWDWGDLHLVALGEAPDDEGLAFLEKDLAKMRRQARAIVFFHLALAGPWSTGNWFGDGDYEARLANVLRGRPIAAIVHGHQHVHGHYVWEGFDVFKPGAAKHHDHSMMVVRAKDDALSVAWLDFDRDAWIGSFVR